MSDSDSLKVGRRHRATPSIERAAEAADSQSGQPTFTPGPWRIVDEAPYLIFHPTLRGVAVATVDYTSGPERQEPMGGFVSSRQMMSDERYRESEQEGWQERQEAEMRANARLIAAAPALYQALKELRRYVAYCDVPTVDAALALADGQNKGR